MVATLSYLIEPERKTPVAGEYDVVVLGGGPAGLAAAAAGVTNFCCLHANVHDEIKQVVRPKDGIASLACVPAIHDLLVKSKTWMPGTRPGMTAERPCPLTPPYSSRP